MEDKIDNNAGSLFERTALGGLRSIVQTGLNTRGDASFVYIV